MEDYRVKTSWRTSRKRKRVMRAFGAEGVLAVMDLWAYAAQERTDGDLAGLTNQDIADEAGWDGDADEFVNVLVGTALLDGEEGFYRIHEWHEHNPYVAGHEDRVEQARKAGLASAEARKKKAEEAERKRAEEEAAKQKSNSKQQPAQPNSTASSTDPNCRSTPSPSPDPSPSPTPTPSVAAPSTAPPVVVGSWNWLHAQMTAWPGWPQQLSPKDVQKGKAREPYAPEEIAFARQETERNKPKTEDGHERPRYFFGVISGQRKDAPQPGSEHAEVTNRGRSPPKSEAQIAREAEIMAAVVEAGYTPGGFVRAEQERLLATPLDAQVVAEIAGNCYGEGYDVRELLDELEAHAGIAAEAAS